MCLYCITSISICMYVQYVCMRIRFAFPLPVEVPFCIHTSLIINMYVCMAASDFVGKAIDGRKRFHNPAEEQPPQSPEVQYR